MLASLTTIDILLDRDTLLSYDLLKDKKPVNHFLNLYLLACAKDKETQVAFSKRLPKTPVFFPAWLPLRFGCGSVF